jgi:hypothetical protein
VNVKDLLTLGLLGGIAYLAYKAFNSNVAQSVIGAPAAAGTSLSNTLFDWLNPNPTGPMVYYTPAFPDGSHHAIPSTSVATDGTFTYGGQTYSLMTDAQGNRYATMGGLMGYQGRAPGPVRKRVRR